MYKKAAIIIQKQDGGLDKAGDNREEREKQTWGEFRIDKMRFLEWVKNETQLDR